jgi:penicillin-binding protein 1A
MTAKKKAASKKPAAKKKAAPKKNTRNKRKGGGGRGRLFLRLLVVGFFLASAALLGAVGVLAYYSRDLPTIEKIRDYKPRQTTRIVDRNGELLGEIFRERRVVVPMDKVPRVLVLAVLAAEDADFYRHEGLDYMGIMRAVIRDVIRGRPAQGASTITQQLVKNLLLTPERTVERKLRELILARRIEQELDKEEILYLYLNHIYLGHGCYGVEAASRFYFGKSVDKLTLAEASLIAGIVQAPSRLSPVKNIEAAKARQRYVLGQVRAKRAQYWPDLPAKDIDAAAKQELELVGRHERGGDAPEVVTLVRSMLRDLVGDEEMMHGGFTVHTSIDVRLQRAARQAIRDGLGEIDKRQKRVGPLKVPKKSKKTRPLVKVDALRSGRTYDAVVTGANDKTREVSLNVAGWPGVAELDEVKRFNPEKLPASAFAPKGARTRVSVQSAGDGDEPARVRLELGPQGAAVVVDARSRDVLALVGGAQAVFGFNRATSAVRQPGSTFKPIAYALGLHEKKYTPASLVLDAPEVFDKWKPENYETWTHKGSVRLREALAQSINMVAVRVTQELTPQAIVKFAQKLGFTTKLEPTLALALGASSVRPIEMVNAYATFAAGGRWAPTRIVKKITRGDGQDVKLPKLEAVRDVMSPASAYLLTSMLQSVVTDGTGKGAAKLGRPVAGKTGTSNKARDAWFVGYTPELVAGVWVGFDDHRPLGRRESGGKSALPIWVDVMRAATEGRPETDFAMPPGLETVSIDPVSALRAYEGMEGAMDEVFLAGTAPIEVATPPDVLTSDDFLMEQMGLPN